jgi:predicted TIM-barrel fold metal-dependent hydrolase
MSRLLSDDEIARLVPAETLPPSPIPTRCVASDEFTPARQTENQKRVAARLAELGESNARRNGLGRRAFFRTAAGLATSFVAMNDVYGPVFSVNAAEAASVDLSLLRQQSLAGQFVFDCHTHFLRDDTRLEGFVRAREAVGRTGWNPQIAGRPQTIEDLKFDNYVKEIFLDSDTKVALISGSPSEEPRDWFLTNEMKADARRRINEAAGSQRLLSHAIFTPGWDGWLEQIQRDAETLRPDAWKGYTVGDNTNKHLARHPWRMDDERITYRGYELFQRSGITTVCVHKGLYPESTERQFPHLVAYAKVDDVGKAAKDWPGLNFVIYHAGFRNTGGDNPTRAAREWERTGRIEWVTDLAEIRERYGVSNVYADLGQVFAQTCVLEPRLCAAVLGQLIKGLGADHVVWGTDAVWSGAPQWQIEALRRIEIPEDMQRQFGYAPLGAADGPVKNGILGENGARIYPVRRRGAGLDWRNDRFAALKRDYEAAGPRPSNLAYGYVQAG